MITDKHGHAPHARVLPMRLHKTAKARDALMRNGPELSQAERRILILCDGRRSQADVIRMLGESSGDSLRLLQAQGFLSPTVDGAPEGATIGAPSTSPWRRIGLGWLGGDRGERSSPVPEPQDSAHPQPDPATVHADLSPGLQAPPARRSGRRSLAASKMYLIDMLQLQRTPEASALAVDIQMAPDEQALVARLLDALDHIHSVAKPSLAMRIAERLLEVLPEAYLGLLEARLAHHAPDVAPSNVIALQARG